ncbi:lysylphosphatidylglycerol synthase transmembrane domain-containing protein [Desulfogranum japonicum]|uniref:lysylphosphatidylglycerol synthase transmembrane domain-containing protein n=1 Tax=Desulfogranum japonicum TaxID=231447 RepID=UPI00041E9D2F|nr:lysylphosphatidylglycerol synthase transmembrane domain-containing protein [Desulfogranum japonicum]
MKILPRISYWLKLCISLSILGIILTQIDWQTFLHTLRSGDIMLLSAAFLLLWVERGWAVVKWHFLLRTQGVAISWWTLFGIYNIGAFWGLFLPSSLSTDVVRGYYLSKNTRNMELSAASVVVDRMMGLFSLLFLCLVSIGVYSSKLQTSVIEHVVLSSLFFILLAVLVHLDWVSDVLEKKIPFFAQHSLGKKLISMHRAFLQFKKFPRILLISFIFSLVLQFIRVITMYVTACAFGIDADIVTFFIVVPITVIVIMIPVSVGGLGVREGAFVSLFGLVGIGVNESFVISGTNSVMVTLIGLMGGIFYIAYKNKVPAEYGQVKQ